MTRKNTHRRQKTSPQKLLIKDSAESVYGKSAPVFLSLADVLKIHTDEIAHYGGIDGVRDMGLLQSALAQPEASFGGAWLHEDLFEMAAAYTFHICLNHPFLDGNKRTALVAAMVFLELNGLLMTDPKELLFNVVLAVAEGKLKKKELADIFRDLPRE